MGARAWYCRNNEKHVRSARERILLRGICVASSWLLTAGEAIKIFSLVYTLGGRQRRIIQLKVATGRERLRQETLPSYLNFLAKRDREREREREESDAHVRRCAARVGDDAGSGISFTRWLTSNDYVMRHGYWFLCCCQ